MSNKYMDLAGKKKLRRLGSGLLINDDDKILICLHAHAEIRTMVIKLDIYVDCLFGSINPP
jgi:hypothetical protein